MKIINNSLIPYEHIDKLIQSNFKIYINIFLDKYTYENIVLHIVN